MKRVFWGIFACLLLFSFSLGCSSSEKKKPKIEMKKVDNSNFTLFVPKRSAKNPKRKFPLLVTFSPGGDVNNLISTWQELAYNNGCALIVSKKYRNDVDVFQLLKELRKEIEYNVIPKHYIDEHKIITAGYSGGGMVSHLFSYFYPKLIAGVIATVGLIHENSIHGDKSYPKGKACVFLASPTDFNYKKMKQNIQFLKSKNWKTQWTEFKGGHRQAPKEVLEKSLKWMLKTLK